MITRPLGVTANIPEGRGLGTQRPSREGAISGSTCAPLGLIESEAKRANRQAGSGSDFPSSDRAPTRPATPDLLWSPPRPQDVPSDAEYAATMSRIEKAAAGIAAILALLPSVDRGPVVRAVLRGLEGVSNG